RKSKHKTNKRQNHNTSYIHRSSKNNNNILAIEILSTITAALTIISIILGICFRRIRKRKLAYKRNQRTQIPIGTSQTPFTTPIDLNSINIEGLAQQLAQLQNNQLPRYNK